MTYEEIDEALKDWEGDVYFVSMLSDFVWSLNEKRVAGYHEQSTPTNKLVVYSTELIDLGMKDLMDYLTKKGVTEEDVLVFCINEDFYPKEPGIWIRLTVIKNVNKKKYESRRDDSGRVSRVNNKDVT
jgi:hypothetical protein